MNYLKYFVYFIMDCISYLTQLVELFLLKTNFVDFTFDTLVSSCNIFKITTNLFSNVYYQFLGNILPLSVALSGY